MQISSIFNTSNGYADFYQDNSIKNSNGNSFEDVVEISCSGQTDSSDKADEGVLPVEAYALPSWYAEFIPEANMLSSQINTEYFSLAEQLRKDDNCLSDEDKNILRNYLRNDPIHQERLAKEEFRQKYGDELSEYSALLNEYFNEALRESGVREGSREDYYEMVILDKNKSEDIHQTMLEKVENDPRFQALMEILGIQSSV